MACVRYPLSPIPLPFSLPPNSLPFQTPAPQPITLDTTIGRTFFSSWLLAPHLERAQRKGKPEDLQETRSTHSVRDDF